MKKLLALMMVLCLASISNGMVLSIFTNGCDISSCGLYHGDTLNFSLYADGFKQGDATTWGLILKPGYTGTGSFSGGVITSAAPDNCFLVTGEEILLWNAMFGTESGVYGGIDTWFISSSYSKPGGIYVSDIILSAKSALLDHPIIQLVTTEDFINYTVVDEVWVDTPEPMTIGLLCLGGLMLRSRK
jgi:hypothetical protein